MPTYDYECAKCGHRFDLFHKMSDEPKAKCPLCKGKAQRLIGTGSGIIFKGSGFYETDYKKKSAGGEKRDSCPGKDSCKGCSLGDKDKKR